MLTSNCDDNINVSRRILRRASSYLHEAEIVKELADVGDDRGANTKSISDVVVHDQVEITLTETRFLKPYTRQLERPG